MAGGFWGVKLQRAWHLCRDLTDEERAERRRKQQEAYRRKKGIPAKAVRQTKVRRTNWAQKYFDIWGKSPGLPLTPKEYAEREPLWNRRVAEREKKG